MNFKQLKDYLFEIGDQKFADFSKSLSNSDYVSIGVKNPVLRQIVNEHKDDEQLKLIDFEIGKYLEVDFIYFGLALSRLKNIDEQLGFLDKHIKEAKSWAITDCVQTYLKKSSFDQFITFFKSHYSSKYIYERRFSYVFGLKHSKNPRISEIFHLFTINEEYMVVMAQAWLLATTAIYFPDDIYAFISKTKDNTLKRKTISKMCDSYRISNEQKERFKMLRK